MDHARGLGAQTVPQAPWGHPHTSRLPPSGGAEQEHAPHPRETPPRRGSSALLLVQGLAPAGAGPETRWGPPWFRCCPGSSCQAAPWDRVSFESHSFPPEGTWTHKELPSWSLRVWSVPRTEGRSVQGETETHNPPQTTSRGTQTCSSHRSQLLAGGRHRLSPVDTKPRRRL